MDTQHETNPNDLMNHFSGRSLKSIVIFTIIVHAVVIVGTSIPFLLRSLGGADTAALSTEERNQLAVKEATSKLREIAEQYGMQPQQLSDQLSGKSTTTPEPPAATPAETPAEPEPPATTTGESPKSEIEKQLEKAEPGPELPPVDEAVDLFK